MNNFFLILFSLLLFSCSSSTEKVEVIDDINVTQESINDDYFDELVKNIYKEPDYSIYKDFFVNYFMNIDTLKKQEVVACGRYIFKVINDEMVIRFNYGDDIEIKGVRTFFLDSNTANVSARLLLFNKGDASLANICTDLIISNYPEPISVIDGFGKITIGETEPHDEYDSYFPTISILVDSLNFFDITKEREIIIKNELLWKVKNVGIPG